LGYLFNSSVKIERADKRKIKIKLKKIKENEK